MPLWVGSMNQLTITFYQHGSPNVAKGSLMLCARAEKVFKSYAHEFAAKVHHKKSPRSSSGMSAECLR
jgi:hypothetical protein